MPRSKSKAWDLLQLWIEDERDRAKRLQDVRSGDVEYWRSARDRVLTFDCVLEAMKVFMGDRQ